MDKTNPAARHFAVPDSWILDPQGEPYIDFEAIRAGTFTLGGTLTATQIRNNQQRIAFNWTGFFVGANGANEKSTTAEIRGVMLDDVDNYIDNWHLTTNIVHPLRFKRIYFNGTNAQDIKILGQTGNE